MLINRVIAGLFLLILFCSTFSEGITTLAFYTNQQYIAKHFCENKDKPVMHCNGKCQLQKKLNQQENKEKQIPERRGENHVEVLSSKTFFSQIILPINTFIKQQYPTTAVNIISRKTTELFHPPQQLFA